MFLYSCQLDLHEFSALCFTQLKINCFRTVLVTVWKKCINLLTCKIIDIFGYRMNLKLTNFVMRVRTDHMIILFLNTCVHWLCYHSYGHFWSSYFFDYFLIFFLYLWFIIFFFAFCSISIQLTILQLSSLLKQADSNRRKLTLIVSFSSYFHIECSSVLCVVTSNACTCSRGKVDWCGVCHATATIFVYMCPVFFVCWCIEGTFLRSYRKKAVIVHCDLY